MEEQSLGGPYVQVAAICTTPLLEQQGQLSIIRIQDRLQLAGPTDQMRPQPLNALWIVISLKSGGILGKYNLTITPVSPSGKRLEGPTVSILFEGQERGAIVSAPLGVVVEEEGLYWFEVTLEGTVLTQIPLRVMYQKMQMMGMPLP